MKITKYVHSCLLIEEGDKKVLMDPGSYSLSEKAISIEMFDKLDYLTITHEHQDHMDVGFIKELVKKFPKVTIMSTKSVAKILEKEGLTAHSGLSSGSKTGRQELKVQTKGDSFIDLKAVPHEEIFMGPSPQNVMITVNEKLAHPGDSHHFKTSTPILALPVAASWGSTTDAVKLATKLRPKAIIPIHDWHWNEEARQWTYKSMHDYFSKLNIKFFGLQTGENIELKF